MTKTGFYEPTQIEHRTQTLFFTKTAGRQPSWGPCYLRFSYILRELALLEACDVTKHVRHLGCHFLFYQELEIR